MVKSKTVKIILIITVIIKNISIVVLFYLAWYKNSFESLILIVGIMYVFEEMRQSEVEKSKKLIYGMITDIANIVSKMLYGESVDDGEKKDLDKAGLNKLN